MWRRGRAVVNLIGAGAGRGGGLCNSGDPAGTSPSSLPHPPPRSGSETSTRETEGAKRGGASGAGPATPTRFVPSSGCLGTAAALTYGLYCFHRGQSQRSQLMMRTRIAAQGFTVAAILAGLAMSALKSRP